MSFREAMSNFPSGVTIVTTTDGEGMPRGFTATSFASVSAEPPLVLVCLDVSAQSHEVFQSVDTWMIHVLDSEQSAVALRFASRGIDKFAGDDFFTNPSGLPQLKHAPVTLRCVRFELHAAGDHTILVGRVEEATVAEADPLVYWQRGFRSLQAADGVQLPVEIDWDVLNRQDSWPPTYGIF